MSFIRRNMWGIGFVVILIGAFGAMFLSSRGSNLPNPNGVAEEKATFTITSEDNVKGNENAKVTLVEWSDFQCPACRAYAPILEDLVKQYPNDVRIVYKHFPLKSIHFRAQDAAQASEAAARQGKFWEMAQLLFAGQDLWSKDKGSSRFEEYALALGLDLVKFKQDYESEEVKNAVESDYKEGLLLKINSTPTFYLNGKKITNPTSIEEFQNLIVSEIQKN